MKLSIIIPVYNEEKTIAEIINRVKKIKLKNIEKEIIVVNDGSTDNTLKEIKRHPNNSLKLINHKINQGKGAAVRTGIKHAKGDYIIIQDADLEYDPNHFINLLNPIINKKAEVVYGTRLARFPNLKKEEKNPRFFLHYLGNRSLSLITSILYGQWITDMETCYKVFPKIVLRDIKLKANGFELEPEITSKLIKRGYRIHEVSISANPRSYREGKKIQTFRDGFKAFKALVVYRFKD